MPALLLLILALAMPAVASAQEPELTPTPTATPTAPPAPTSTPTPTPTPTPPTPPPAPAPVAPSAWETGAVLNEHPLVKPTIAPALAYWKRIGGLPSIQLACGGFPVIRSVIWMPLTVAAWGAGRDGEKPCGIWIEEAYLAHVQATSGYGFWQALRRVCKAMTHEVGHALGLPHEYRGDPPVLVMGGNPDYVETPECMAAFPDTPDTPPPSRPAIAAPPPEAPEPGQRWTYCVPAWSTATAKTKRLWKQRRYASSRREFRRWARKHPRRALRLKRDGQYCWMAG